MEIRTCEEYVLTVVEHQRDEIERLKDQLIELEETNCNQSHTIGNLMLKNKELEEMLDSVLGMIEYTEEEFVKYSFGVSEFSNDYEAFDKIYKSRKENNDADVL